MDDINNNNQMFTWDNIEALWENIKMMARKILANQSEKYSWRPTALATEALRRIHERNGKWTEVTWDNKGAFFKHCQKAMISAINDRHRYDAAIKRPSKASTKSLEDLVQARSPIPFIRENFEIFITFKQVTDRIAKNDQNSADLLRYRFINGLSVREVAVIMGKSERHMRRLFAKAIGKLKSIIQDTDDN